MTHKLILESELWHHATTGKSKLLLYRFHFLDVCRHHAFFVTFDPCVYGGARKTAKTFLTNVPTLKAMAQRCNGGHTHLPFGRQKLPSGKYAYATPKKRPILDLFVFR